MGDRYDEMGVPWQGRYDRRAPRKWTLSNEYLDAFNAAVLRLDWSHVGVCPRCKQPENTPCRDQRWRARVVYTNTPHKERPDFSTGVVS